MTPGMPEEAAAGLQKTRTEAGSARPAVSAAPPLAFPAWPRRCSTTSRRVLVMDW